MNWHRLILWIVAIACATLGLRALRDTVRFTIEIGAPRAVIAPPPAFPPIPAETLRALPRWEPPRYGAIPSAASTADRDTTPDRIRSGARGGSLFSPRIGVLQNTVAGHAGRDRAARLGVGGPRVIFAQLRSAADHLAHNQEGAGSSPAAASILDSRQISSSRAGLPCRPLAASSGAESVSRAAAANRSNLSVPTVVNHV